MEKNLLNNKSKEELQKKYFESIAKLIFGRVENRISIDTLFVQDLMAIICEYFNLEGEVFETEIDEKQFLNINLTNSIHNAIAIYALGDDKELAINKEMLARITPPFDNLKEYDIYFYQYLYLTRIILKEIEKYRQLESFEKNRENTLQNKILKMSYFQYIEMLYKYYNRNFLCHTEKLKKHLMKYSNIFHQYRQLAPKERYASISAFETILEIGELLELEKINVVNKIELCNTLLNPYSFVRGYTVRDETIELSPTIYYLEELAITEKEAKNIKKLLQQTENLKANERLKLGLTLTPNELYKARKYQRELERALRLKP